MYREAALRPQPTLVIDGSRYDVDYFGMDDGRSDEPTDARRFIFQLGQGLMIYLYVVQAGSVEKPGHFFHTFWTKDCAVAEVEMEDHGAPGRVEGSFEVPVLFPLLQIDGGRSRYRVESARFRATPSDQAQGLELVFQLSGEGGPARLVWEREGGYRLEREGREPQPLGPEFAFGD